MRRAQRPFVVEVKRGTKRSFFSEIKEENFQTPKVEVKAFARLFSPPPPSHDHNNGTDLAGRSGRVLQDLAAPEPILILEEEPVPVRRGRKPGSKNKPKSIVVETSVRPDHYRLRPEFNAARTDSPVIALAMAQPALSSAPVPRPPSVPSASVSSKSLRSPSAPSVPLPMPIAAERPKAQHEDEVSREPPPQPRPAMEAMPASPRPRLRTRSLILKRYVLGTEPLPGERWRDRARRKG